MLFTTDSTEGYPCTHDAKHQLDSLNIEFSITEGMVMMQRTHLHRQERDEQ